MRKALQMGAHSGIHIVDDALAGSDALGTSLVLANVLKDRGFGPHPVRLGIDRRADERRARNGRVPARAAPLTFANKVDIEGGTVKIRRQTDYGYDNVEGELPAVISVAEKINEPRFPSFKGIMAAKKKPIETLTTSDAGLSAGDVGLARRAALSSSSPPVPRRPPG